MKKIKKIREKINVIRKAKTPANGFFVIRDNSTLAELRLECEWQILFPIDTIHYPKAIDNPWPQPECWQKTSAIDETLSTMTKITNKSHLRLRANERTKAGALVRAEARGAFEMEHSTAFLAAYRKMTTPTALTKLTRKISDLQGQQKALLPAMRAYNSAIMLARRTAAADRRAANQEALTSGRFWDADKEALKGYFHPPFEKNYLADVSEKWRAALYTEMESTAWKDRNGNWRHKNIGTGRGYLCGIDDNGDEWGHRVNLAKYLSCDQYGDHGYVSTVEEAMSELFRVALKKMATCERQGDLLFCPESIPKEIIMNEQAKPWQVRESHTVASEGLQRNGRYFRSENPITVTHTSHSKITLQPGDYRLYALQVEDAD